MSEGAEGPQDVSRGLLADPGAELEPPGQVAGGGGGAGCPLGLDQLGELIQHGVSGCGLGEHHGDQPMRALGDFAGELGVKGQRLSRVGGRRLVPE